MRKWPLSLRASCYLLVVHHWMDGRAESALDLCGHLGCNSNIKSGPFNPLNLDHVVHHPRCSWGYYRLLRYLSYIIDSYVLHTASNNSWPHSPTPCSVRRSGFPAFAYGAWASHIHAQGVQDPWLRSRQHGTSSGFNGHWCPGANVANSMLFWKFGERIRSASSYSVKTLLLSMPGTSCIMANTFRYDSDVNGPMHRNRKPSYY